MRFGAWKNPRRSIYRSLVAQAEFIALQGSRTGAERYNATDAFVAFARQMNSIDGQVFVFFVMTVAAAEVAVGLAIIVNLFRLRESVMVDEANLLKG